MMAGNVQNRYTANGWRKSWKTNPLTTGCIELNDKNKATALYLVVRLNLLNELAETNLITNKHSLCLTLITERMN